MKFPVFLCLPLMLAGCASQNPQQSSESGLRAPQKLQSLVDARRDFHTVLLPQKRDASPAEIAPPAVFRTLKYPAPAGNLTAYLSPDPKNGKKNPAILWITGGDCNSIGDVWSGAPRDNDQTAAAYRKAGIVMMFPSLRGGNDNPGAKEGFLGEVDDVLAAAKCLEKQPYVDSKRIYLGGHSTGGTLALLVAQSSPRFRGVFAFGPIDDVTNYGTDSGFTPFDLANPKEVEVRSPIHWLASLQSPTWILEGSEGNAEALKAMEKANQNSQAHFVLINGASHFATLAPTNELIARKILADTGAVSNISLEQNEINALFAP